MADNEAINASVLADDDIQIDTDDASEASTTPVKDAFDRGVLGRDLPNVPIPQNDPNARPDPVPFKHEAPPIDLSREASLHLDQARGFAAEIARIKSDAADRLLGAADPLMEKIDTVMSRIDVTKLDVEKAIAEAVGPLRTLPHLDEETRKKVIAAATEKARSDLLTERGKELEGLASEVVAMAEHMEKQLAFEERFSDPELREALDGQRHPAEKASEDWLTSKLESQPMSEASETYDLLLLAKDFDRVRRFERSALSAVSNVLAGIDKASAPPNKLSAEAKERLSRERTAALELRSKIQQHRASRTPKSITHAKALLANVKTAWQRIAGFDARHGAGAVSASEMNAARMDESRMTRMREQAKSWRPVEGWTGRHFRLRKAGS